MAKFFENFQPLLNYFQNNPIDPDENSTKRFPKYIKDTKLFAYQIQEPFFRKSVLTQLKTVFLTIKNPFKLSNKKDTKAPGINYEAFTDPQKKKLKKFEDFINFLLRRYKVGASKKGVADAVNKALKMETVWMRWKMNGCTPYELKMGEEKVKRLQDGECLVDKLYKRSGKMDGQVKGWLRTDVDYTHLDALDKTNLMVSPIFPSKCDFFGIFLSFLFLRLI